MSMSNTFFVIIARRFERFCSLQITTDARRENLRDRHRNFDVDDVANFSLTAELDRNA